MLLIYITVHLMTITLIKILTKFDDYRVPQQVECVLADKAFLPYRRLNFKSSTSTITITVSSYERPVRVKPKIKFKALHSAKSVRISGEGKKLENLIPNSG
ncbi:hypothetical protein Trydic_g9789 [Trypoxylus dichotomus]